MAEFINTIDVLGDDAVIDSIINGTITEYKDNVITKVEQYAFHSCAALTKVAVPNATLIETYAFFGCSAMESIDLSSVTTIKNYAFKQCTALTEVYCPLLSGSLYYTFPDCTSLAKADLPKVTSLNAEVFSKCTALTALILRVDRVCTLAHTNCFTNTPISLGTGYIYVPMALVDSYKAATNWSTFATQFRAIEDYSVDGTVTGELDETKI